MFTHFDFMIMHHQLPRIHDFDPVTSMWVCWVDVIKKAYNGKTSML